MIYSQRNLLACSILAFIITIGSPLTSHGQSAKNVMDKMRDTLKKQKEISIAYEQSYRWKSSNTGSKTTGRLDLKELKMFRLLTDEQTIVSDGETIWSYSAFTDQVIIERVSKSSGTKIPSDFLFDYPEDYYANLSEENKFEGEYLIELTPKDKSSFVTVIRIWVDSEDYLTRKIEYVDINKNVTLWEITEINLYPEFDKSHFILKPPPGSKVIDLR